MMLSRSCGGVFRRILYIASSNMRSAASAVMWSERAISSKDMA